MMALPPRLFCPDASPDPALPPKLAARRRSALRARYRAGGPIDLTLIAAELVDLSPSPNAAARAQIVGLLRHALLALEPRALTILQLRFVEGEEDATIAEVLDLSESEVVTARTRACAHLATALDGSAG